MSTGTAKRPQDQARPAGFEPATPGLEGRVFHVEHSSFYRVRYALAQFTGTIISPVRFRFYRLHGYSRLAALWFSLPR